MNDWEGLVWILGSLVLESSLVSGPGGTLDVEAVDANTFWIHCECLLNLSIFASNDFLKDFGLWLDGIERPLLLRVLSGDFLHSSCEETLWIVEPS